jgi:ABC-type Fe2+-enterobactin transport system substrate-binding protein
MRETMISLQGLEAQYRAIMVLLERCEESIAGRDLDRLEISVLGIDQALSGLAQVSAQLAGRPMMPGEDKAWESLADAMRQALTRTEQNRAQIQMWIGQTQDILSQMSRGGQAVNGYSVIGRPDGAEFLSARG